MGLGTIKKLQKYQSGKELTEYQPQYIIHRKTLLEESESLFEVIYYNSKTVQEKYRTND